MADAGPHYWRQLSTPDNVSPSGVQSATSLQKDLELEVTESVFAGGRTRSAERSARATADAEAARTVSAEQSVLLDAAQSFIQVLCSRAILRLRDQSEALYKKELEGARARLLSGAATRTDVAQAEGHLAGAVADRESGEGDLRAAVSHFEATIGHAPGDLTAPTRPLEALPSDLAAAEQQMLAGNPDVHAAESDEVAAGYSLAEARSELYPKLDLVLAVDRNQNALIRTPELNNPSRLDDVSVLLRLTVPITDGGETFAKIRSAEAAHRRSLFSLNATRRTTMDKLRAAWSAEESARQRLKSLQEEIDTDTIAFQGTTAEHLAGTRSLLDVLLSEDALTGAQISLETTRCDARNDEFQILGAIGGLTLRGLQLSTSTSNETLQ